MNIFLEKQKLPKLTHEKVEYLNSTTSNIIYKIKYPNPFNKEDSSPDCFITQLYQIFK